MKFIVNLLILNICFCLILKAQTNHSSKTVYQEFSTQIKGVTFSVDPRIEFFHAIELAGGIPLINYIDLEYKQKIKIHFKPYKDHPLFSYILKNAPKGNLFNSIDGPIWFLLHLTNDFEWRKDILFPDAKNPYIDSLRIYLKDLAVKSNYPRFFNSNAELYRISLSTIKYNIADFDEKNRMLKYCGVTTGDRIQFNVIINFLGWGNFSPRFFKKTGAEFYAVIAPQGNALKIPTFNLNALYHLLWHEFGHSFANPSVEKIEPKFEVLNYLWEPIRESMKYQAYHTWSVVIKEHITEAIACRLAAEKFGEDYAELNFIRPQKGKRWIYLTPIINALKIYEANRLLYPTLDSFMPRIAEALKAVQQTEIHQWMAETDLLRTPDVKTMPSIGDIYAKDNLLIILATDEVDQAADLRLKRFIEDFKNSNKMLMKARIVSDTTALKMDLSEFNLMVWGTPTGNLFLKKYMQELPLIVKGNMVISDSAYKGDGYAILAAWTNPANTKNMMAIYTAQNPDNLVNFNNVMNGGGNYHIIQNFITFKIGSFTKGDSVWGAN